MIQPVRSALQASRAAEYLHALPRALLLCLEHLRQVDVCRHVKVQVAIAVIVGESSTRMPLKATGYTGRFRHVSERAIAIVAEKIRLPDVGKEKIGEAIVVVIGRGAACTPSKRTHTGLLRNVGESAVTVVAIEIVVVRAAAAGSFGIQIFQRPAIHDVQIEQAVVVIVKPADAAAVNLDNGRLARLSANRDTVEARTGACVAKPDTRSRRIRGSEMHRHKNRDEHENCAGNKNAHRFFHRSVSP